MSAFEDSVVPAWRAASSSSSRKPVCGAGRISSTPSRSPICLFRMAEERVRLGDEQDDVLVEEGLDPEVGVGEGQVSPLHSRGPRLRAARRAPTR